MASNFTRDGLDLDSLLVTQANKQSIPIASRKSGNNSVWSVFGLGYGWGINDVGQLGINQVDGDSGYPDYTPISSTKLDPNQIVVVTDWNSVSAGQHGCGIDTSSRLWSWGWNQNGQLGLGDTTSRISPVQVGALTNWSSVSASYGYCLAIKTDGTLWSWGQNEATSGQLGLGDRTHRSSPVQVGALTAWSLVSAGTYHSLSIKTDGTLWSWGLNTNGRLGTSDTTQDHHQYKLVH